MTKPERPELDGYSPPPSLPIDEPDVTPYPQPEHPDTGHRMPLGTNFIERQVDALCNKLLSLGVTREEIAAILTAAAEPYVGPDELYGAR